MNVLGHVSNICFGLYDKKYSKDWSDKLEFIIANYDSVEIGDHTIIFMVNGLEIEVWIANKFYSYGHLRSVGDKCGLKIAQFRPSYALMRRLYDLEVGLKNKKIDEEKYEIDRKLKAAFIAK